MGYYEMSVDQHPLREGVRDNTNHYVTGRDGGREIDLRKFALEGMELFGLLEEYRNGDFIFRDNLKANLDHADSVYCNINQRIDAYIASQGIEAPPAPEYTPCWEPNQERSELNLANAGISTIIWCIGFRPDFHRLDASVFNGQGHPIHKRGVTQQPGLYFIGLPWLHTWGSGRFSGVAADAEYLVERIKAYQRQQDAALQPLSEQASA